MVEINPLVVTQSGDLLALDAKMNFDDNAICGTRTSAGCATSRRGSLEVEEPRSSR
jgi:succinyl-CoA synthetase beta subunit